VEKSMTALLICACSGASTTLTSVMRIQPPDDLWVAPAVEPRTTSSAGSLICPAALSPSPVSIRETMSVTRRAMAW
jgi:hypothetical protein